jgi:hypothetical protein
MTAVQVHSYFVLSTSSRNNFVIQDVFIIPAGAAGASAELERRKFTAEEGVCILVILILQEDDYDFVGSSHSVKW